MRSPFFRLAILLPAALLGILVPAPARADVDPASGIDFVRVGSAGNAAFNIVDPDNPDSRIVGRGSVAYEYFIGRMEVTTAQWMEFANVAYDAPLAQRHPFLSRFGPEIWGAQEDFTYSGPGIRWKLPAGVPDAGMRPVYGIGWRDAALFANWLHNGKQNNRATLFTGAYDTSTWGDLGGGQFSDAPRHLPGAKYWIPTLDEALKAAHYDPNRFGPDQGGWWTHKNMRTTPGIPGPPGIGTTTAGWQDPNSQSGELDVPLGAYPNSLSPWGLLDTSGGTIEWVEEATPSSQRARGIFGSAAGRVWGSYFDSAYGLTSGGPGADALSGLRIASSVPAPNSLAILGACTLVLHRRTRREDMLFRSGLILGVVLAGL